MCRAREELSWRDARKQMAMLKPAFGLASKIDPSLPKHLPMTNHLLMAMSSIARRGAASRKANKQAEAEGKTPLRGKLAKRAQRAAAKAAIAATTSAGESEGAAKGGGRR